MGDKISPKHLKAATTELLSFVHKKNEEATQLIDANDETITVQYTLLNMPTHNVVSGTKYIRAPMILLPHPLFGKTTDKTCCLFVRDPPKNDPEFWKRWHRENPLPGLTKIMPIRKLKGKYRHFEGKRLLSQRFDLFLCDSVVANMTQDLLGSTFLKKAHKFPHTVVLGEKPNVNKYKLNVPKAMESVQCRLPSSASGAVKVGRCNMTADQVLKNMKVVLEHLWTAFDTQYGLRSVHVRATRSPALPLWEIPAEETQAVKFRKKKNKKDAARSSDSQDCDAKPSTDKRKRERDDTAEADAAKPMKKAKKSSSKEAKDGKKNAPAAEAESAETKAPKKNKRAKNKAPAEEIEVENVPKKAKREKSNAPRAEPESAETDAPKKDKRAKNKALVADAELENVVKNARHAEKNAPAADSTNAENSASKKTQQAKNKAPAAEVETAENTAPKKAKHTKHDAPVAEVDTVEKADVDRTHKASKKAKRAKKNVAAAEIENGEKDPPVKPDPVTPAKPNPANAGHAASSMSTPVALLNPKKGNEAQETPVNSKSQIVRTYSVVHNVPTPMAPKKNYGGSLHEIETAAGLPRKLKLSRENSDGATVPVTKAKKKKSSKNKENAPL